MSVMNNRLFTFFILFLFATITSFAQSIVSDKIVVADFDFKSISYGEYTVQKNAEYKAIVATNTNRDHFRIRKEDSGIISVTSKGKIKSITVEWNSSSTSSKSILEVCVKGNTAYKSITDVYNNGNVYATISYDAENPKSVLAIDTKNNIDFIGIRVKNNSNVCYLNSITIEWISDDSGTELGQVAAPVFSLDENLTYTAPQILSISSATEDAQIYYTVDGAVPTTNSTQYVSPLELSSTTTVKAFAAKDGMNNSAVVSATFKFESPIEPGPETTDEYYNYQQITSEDELHTDGVYLIVNKDACAVLSWQNTNNRAAIFLTPDDFNDSGLTISSELVASEVPDKLKAREVFLVNVPGTQYFYIEDKVQGGYLLAPYATSQDAYSLLTGKKEENSKASIIINEGDAVISFNPDKSKDYTSHILRYNNLSRLFSCYGTDSQKPIQLYQKVISFEIKSVGYSTFYSDMPFVMPEGVKGGVIYERNGNTLTIDYSYPSGSVVPARTALILKGNVGKYYGRVVTSDEKAPQNSYLHGTVDSEGNTYVPGGDYNYYKLTQYKGEIGFWPGAENCGPFANGKNKAYLAIPSDNSQVLLQGFSLNSLDDITGITLSEEPLAKPDRIYDLNGRLIHVNHESELPAGIFIVNGRVVIKNN